MKKIVIVGAAGYVGQFLVDELNKQGIKPYTVTRANGAIILSRKNVENIFIEDIKKANIKADVLINLAYPTGNKSYLVKKDNDDLINLLASVSDENTKIIHTSTLAVFGFDLKYPVKADKVKMRHDWIYVESKIYFENALLEKFKKNEVHIVRFGNVWGPASKNWTVPIMNNILYNQPTAVFERDGYCNATDVHNAADYLQYLAFSPSTQGHYFYHLAELYDTKWSFWLEKFSSLFSMPIKYVYDLPGVSESKNFVQDVKRELGKNSPVKTFTNLYKSKIAGSYLRSFLSVLPVSMLTKMERENVLPRFTEQVESATFFTIMSCDMPFESKTDAGWVAPKSPETSWQAVNAWIKEINLNY